MHRIQRSKRVVSLIISALFCWNAGSLSTESARSQNFHDLKKVGDTTKAEKILVMHIVLGECESCVVGFRSALECVKNHLPSLKLKVVAGVVCDREIELKIFRKNYDWEMPVIRDSGTFRKELGVPGNTRITLLSPKGKVLAHISDEDFLRDEQCERFLQILNE